MQMHRYQEPGGRWPCIVMSREGGVQMIAAKIRTTMQTTTEWWSKYMKEDVLFSLLSTSVRLLSSQLLFYCPIIPTHYFLKFFPPFSLSPSLFFSLPSPLSSTPYLVSLHPSPCSLCWSCCCSLLTKATQWSANSKYETLKALDTNLAQCFHVFQYYNAFDASDRLKALCCFMEKRRAGLEHTQSGQKHTSHFKCHILTSKLTRESCVSSEPRALRMYFTSGWQLNQTVPRNFVAQCLCLWDLWTPLKGRLKPNPFRLFLRSGFMSLALVFYCEVFWDIFCSKVL